MTGRRELPSDVRFSTSKMGGSLPAAHEISTSFRPFVSIPDAQTAACASVTLAKGMSAVANLGGLLGAFLEGFIDITMDLSSTVPKGDNKVNNDGGVVKLGYFESGYLTRTVVSRGPVVFVSVLCSSK